MNKIYTFFQNGWSDFLNWFGSAEASVVSHAKSIIDELAPVFKKNLLDDGTALLTAITTAILAGGNPLAGIIAGAEALLPVLETQGIALSKEAALTLSAMVSAKLSAAQVITTAPAAPPPVA